MHHLCQSASGVRTQGPSSCRAGRRQLALGSTEGLDVNHSRCRGGRGGAVGRFTCEEQPQQLRETKMQGTQQPHIMKFTRDIAPNGGRYTLRPESNCEGFQLYTVVTRGSQNGKIMLFRGIKLLP